MERVLEVLKKIQTNKEYGDILIKYEAGVFTICEKKKKILLKRKEG
jgi:hypothetical protein